MIGLTNSVWHIGLDLSRISECDTVTKRRPVLFSIVAFKTLDISQGSVAIHFRCGGIFSDSIITNFLLILRVK